MPSTSIPGSQTQPVHTALVVDDSPEMARMVALFLSRLGYRVSTAAAAEDAMQMDPTGYDLVMADLFMPGKSGVDLMEWFRARNPASRVIIMSGAFPAGGPLRAALAAADQLLIKPFRLAELRAVLAAVAEK